MRVVQAQGLRALIESSRIAPLNEHPSESERAAHWRKHGIVSVGRFPRASALRFVWVGLSLLLACGAPSTSSGNVGPERVGAPSVEREPDWIDPQSDEDEDSIRYECDRCPEERETWNGILDADGCPDTSGASHAVIEHPTNRFGFPIDVVEFPGGSAVAPSDAGQRVLMMVAQGELRLAGADSIACVGQADPAEQNPDALATARAHVTCGILQQLLIAPSTATWSEISVGTGEITSESHPGDAPRSRGALVVTRAEDIDVWGLVGRRFERAPASPRTLSYDPPLAPECEPE